MTIYNYWAGFVGGGGGMNLHSGQSKLSKTKQFAAFRSCTSEAYIMLNVSLCCYFFSLRRRFAIVYEDEDLSQTGFEDFIVQSANARFVSILYVL